MNSRHRKTVESIYKSPLQSEKTTDKGAVISVRRFLENLGVKYDGI
jgi:hypothetical protein